jgi:hypothetical protein
MAQGREKAETSPHFVWAIYECLIWALSPFELFEIASSSATTLLEDALNRFFMWNLVLIRPAGSDDIIGIAEGEDSSGMRSQTSWARFGKRTSQGYKNLILK